MFLIFLLKIKYKKIILFFLILKYMGIGDWGFGPIPNPQSPIPNPQ